MLDPQFLTLREVAALTRLSRSTIYRLVERRELPHVLIACRLRFRQDAVLAWLKRHERAVARPRRERRRVA